MTRICTCLLLLGLAAPLSQVPGAESGAAPDLHIAVDSRVELLSLVFRLAGNPEYNQARVASYASEADQHFAPFRDHSAIELARRLRNTQGISYDACMSMAVHLTDGESLQLRVPLDPWPEGLDSRWTPQSARNFVNQIQQFAKDSAFHDFFQAHKPLYQTTTNRLSELMKKSMHLDWFNDFFGERPRSRFTLIPGLLNGGACYGARCAESSGTTELFCILGVWQTDAEGLPVFNNSMLSTVVHEFSHSYANPVIDGCRRELAAAGTALYKPVSQRMRAQAYGNAHTMLCESLVRACQVRYHHRFDGPDAARKAIAGEVKRGFLWMEELAAVLAQYETNRQAFPTLASFSPRLVDFFNNYATSFETRQKALDAARPKVVSIIPANGATNVDPATAEIQVKFDRPMKDKAWAFVGGGPHCPETTGKPHYDTTRTTWTVPVKLRPDWNYEFRLNSENFEAFQSETGAILQSVQVNFSTRGASGKLAESAGNPSSP
ncbi:MAG TPA: DUF4932 domain-containing protein [Clostridia bacterium]|nr:DUF4932 domain-containing protein [Clostridia bacterium]